MKKICFGLLVAFLAGLFLYGCGQVANNGSTPVPQTYGVILGTVKSSTGAVLGAVTITASATSASTNDQGWFNISNVAATTREIISFSKTGYVSATKVFSVTSGQSTFVEMVLYPSSTTRTFANASGITTTETTATGLTITATIDPNSLVDSAGAVYSGNVSMSLTPQDPTTSLEAFPGNFEGVNTAGSTVPIQSFGFFNLSLTNSAGTSLGLASGSSLRISMLVPSAMRTDAAAEGTIPLWYFNSTTAKWIQAGVATYDATTTSMVGTILGSSISAASVSGQAATPPLPAAWNIDKPIASTGTISGKVVDSFGNAIQNAEVVCTGNGFRFSGFTDSNGNFTKISVPAGILFDYQAQKAGKKSTVQSITTVLAANEDRTVSNITISLASVMQITLTWGENPRDIDSHITVPNSVEGNARYHLYWSNRSTTPSTSWPYAYLDTDDTTSYGPEVVSVYKLYKGVYRYCIHDYAGDGTISNSGANVNLIISTGSHAGIYNFTPASGATGVNDVWSVFDVTVDSSGNISSISTLNTFQHNISSSSHEAFSPNGEQTIGSLGIMGVLNTK